jgi:adenylate kinase
MKVVGKLGIRRALPRNVIVLLGGPGAGKGTQAEGISGWLRIPHISSGQLLRSEVAAGTPLGLRAKAIIDAGGMVGDDLVDELILKRIRNEDCSNGFVLDGYPRNVGQAVRFEGTLPMWDRQIVIDLTTDLGKMIGRLTHRRTCQACGAIYHLITSPAKRPEVSDQCNETLMQRSDDHEDVIRERFKAYEAMSERLTKLYKRMGIYHVVDGMRPADEVASEIWQLLEYEIIEVPLAGRVAAD